METNQQQQRQQQYALVSCAEPLELEEEHAKNTDTATLLTQTFETYASLYPNPNLAHENEERDRLLRAVSAAHHAVQVNPKKNKRRWGLWFGRNRAEEDQPASKKVIVQDDDDRLQYIEVENNNDPWLLGTAFRLDTTNIPDEAYSVARKQLCRRNPNVVQCGWEGSGGSINNTTLVIVGLGCLVECNANHKQQTIQYTRDRQQLLDLAKSLNVDPQSVVSCARATTLGPNCVCVSWGLMQDGHVLFYRRLAQQQQDDTHGVVWEPVGVFAPTKAVQDSLFDLFLEEDAHMSALLSVSDLTLLVVEFPDQAPAVTLVVARLGGFLELVPLPLALWDGPPIQPPKRPKTRAGDHFASRLPRVLGGVLALTTADYHSDIVGVDAFRTTVDPDNSEWNQELYPQSHPAEHVVATFGGKDGSEVVTFWSVSTLIDEQGATSLSANLMEALDMGRLGPAVSIFASPDILRHWRKPRQVELRLDDAAVEPQVPGVTTLSVPAPIVGLRFMFRETTVRAALLDYNGGATILDCNLLERAASQTLSMEEHQLLYQNDDEDAIVPLVSISQGRSEIQQKLSCVGDAMPPFVLSAEWFNFESMSDESGLAVLTRKPLSLRFWLPNSESESQVTNIPCPSFHSGSLYSFTSTDALCLALQGRQISFCSVQELGPSDIVQSLVQSSQFREAIAAAERLTTSEHDSISDVIEDCKRKVWESEHDVSVLETTRDDAYVVMETMTMGADNGSGAVLKGSFDLYRSVCHLAVKRLKTVRLGASLSIASSVEGVHAVANKIKDRIVLIGTYQLLCDRLSFEPSMEHFYREFLSIPLQGLAASLTKQSALDVLSLVWCRHWRSIMTRDFTVLDELPLCLHPSSYQHLLPVAKNGDSDSLAPLFLSFSVTKPLTSLSKLPEYVEGLYGMRTTLDDNDKDLVAERNGFLANANEDLWRINETVSVAEWYAERSSSIDCFVGCVDHASSFSKLALSALRLDRNDDELDSSSLPPSLAKLISDVRFADTLADLASDQADSKLITELASFNHDSFAAMDTEKLVSMVMNCPGKSVDLKGRFKRFLLPVLKERLREDNQGTFVSRVDALLTAFCVSLFRHCSDEQTARDALSVCARLCQESRTSLEKSQRLVQDKKNLIRLVMTIVEKFFEDCREILFSEKGFRVVVELLWIMYESLPQTIPSNIGDDNELRGLLNDTDLLCKDLTMLEICTGWLGPRAARLPLPMSDAEADQVLLAGNKIIESLCHALCQQIPEDVLEKRDLDQCLAVLKVFLHDARAINTCFDGRLGLQELLSKHLVGSILAKRQIGVLGAFLSLAGSELVDQSIVTKLVMAVYNEGLHGTGSFDAQNSRASSMACQDVLAEWLPELRVQFQVMRRYLDASHQISKILESDELDRFRPGSLQGIHPLDIVDMVLDEAPTCFIQHCNQWADPSWALEANESIRRHLNNTAATSREGPPLSGQLNLPPLPGQPIFHLASILGLDDNASVIAVKSRVLSHGISSKLFGASAAICRTLFSDISLSKADPLPLFDSVAKLAYSDEFNDDETKAELCSLALSFRDELLTVQHSQMMTAILEASNRMDHRNRIATKGKNGAVTTFFRFYVETHKEYTAALGDLYLTLHNQLLDCVVDDALLQALARFSMFWCISRGTRPVSGAFDPFRYSSTEAILALAASLLLHIREKELAHASLSELSDIFSQQSAAASQTNRGSLSVKWKTPNPDIVNALVGRGYSQFGAIRAAAMANGNEFNDALQWAVAHSLDPGFDDPIVLVKELEPQLDYESAGRLNHVLETLQKVVSGSLSVSEIFHFSTGSLDDARQGQATTNGQREDLKARTINIRAGADPSPEEKAPDDGWEDDDDDFFDSDAFDQLDPVSNEVQELKPFTTSTQNNPEQASQDAIQPDILSSEESKNDPECLSVAKLHDEVPKKYQPENSEGSQDTGTAAVVHAKSDASLPTNTPVQPVPQLSVTQTIPTNISDRSNPPANGFITSDRSNGGLKVPAKQKSPPKLKINIPSRSENERSTPGSKTPSKRGTPTILTPSPSSADRATLLKVGQAAFRSARASSPSRQKERKRLMEEGRQLLQRTRSNSAEQPFPYSLRSRGPPPPSPPAEKPKEEAMDREEPPTSAYSLRSKGPPPSQSPPPPEEEKAVPQEPVEKTNEDDGWDDFDFDI